RSLFLQQRHRLKLEAFRGPCPSEMECRHLDSNPLNNKLENLVWGMPAENLADRRAMGRGIVLDERRVRYIRSSGKTLQALAQELTCHITTVWSAKHRTTPVPRVFKILHIFHGGLLRVEEGVRHRVPA